MSCFPCECLSFPNDRLSFLNLPFYTSNREGKAKNKESNSVQMARLTTIHTCVYWTVGPKPEETRTYYMHFQHMKIESENTLTTKSNDLRNVFIPA